MMTVFNVHYFQAKMKIGSIGLRLVQCMHYMLNPIAYLPNVSLQTHSQFQTFDCLSNCQTFD